MFGLIPYTTNLARREAGNDFMDPFSDDFFRAFFGKDNNANAFRVDVRDKGDSYLMEADLPGVEKENVHVSINDGTLTISAEIKDAKDEKNDNYVCRERRYGTMTRSFSLDGVNEEGVSAEYKDGVLKLTLPKVTETAPVAREISIN